MQYFYFSRPGPLFELLGCGNIISEKHSSHCFTSACGESAATVLIHGNSSARIVLTQRGVIIRIDPGFFAGRVRYLVDGRRRRAVAPSSPPPIVTRVGLAGLYR